MLALTPWDLLSILGLPALGLFGTALGFRLFPSFFAARLRVVIFPCRSLRLIPSGDGTPLSIYQTAPNLRMPKRIREKTN